MLEYLLDVLEFLHALPHHVLLNRSFIHSIYLTAVFASNYVDQDFKRA